MVVSPSVQIVQQSHHTGTVQNSVVRCEGTACPLAVRCVVEMRRQEVHGVEKTSRPGLSVVHSRCLHVCCQVLVVEGPNQYRCSAQVQTSIDEGQWIEHQPMTSLDSGGPIEFVVPGTGDAYIDLANTYLFVRAKIIRGAGTNLADDTPVAPVNNWLHSLFSQVDVYLNDTLVTPSSNTYPFRAYVETLLSYGAEAKKTQLTSQLWYKDTAGHMDATQANGGNAGLIERRRHIVGSRVVEIMGRLHVDLFMQDRFLLNGVTVRIRLVRSKDTFSLMAGGANLDYKVCRPYSGRRTVRAQGRIESDGYDGAHTSVGEGNGEISATPGRLQGILNTAGRRVAHPREPVPRNTTETHHPVVCRQ